MHNARSGDAHVLSEDLGQVLVHRNALPQGVGPGGTTTFFHFAPGPPCTTPREEVTPKFSGRRFVTDAPEG